MFSPGSISSGILVFLEPPGIRWSGKNLETGRKMGEFASFGDFSASALKVATTLLSTKTAVRSAGASASRKRISGMCSATG